MTGEVKVLTARTDPEVLIYLFIYFDLFLSTKLERGKLRFKHRGYLKLRQGEMVQRNGS